MIALVLLALINACVAAFAIDLASKWGFIEYWQVHGGEMISKMFNCYFCLSWWVNVALAIIALLTTQHIECVFLPFISTPITKNLI